MTLDKTFIVLRRLRRVERKIDHSKSAVSVMLCGSADGALLLPFVIYMAKNMYKGLTLNGPTGACYDFWPSGWFNQRTFERWFLEVFLPHANELQGSQVLIGDNLAPHFSLDVVAACEEHNISFVPFCRVQLTSFSHWM